MQWRWLAPQLTWRHRRVYVCCVYVCKCLSRNVLDQKVAFSLITCGLSTTIQQMIITLVNHNQHDVYAHNHLCVRLCVCVFSAVILAAWAFKFYHLLLFTTTTGRLFQPITLYTHTVHMYWCTSRCLRLTQSILKLHTMLLSRSLTHAHPCRHPSKLTWESVGVRARNRERERVSGMFAFASTIVRWSRVSQLLSSAAWSQLLAVCVEQLSLPLSFAVSVCC